MLHRHSSIASYGGPESITAVAHNQ